MTTTPAREAIRDEVLEEAACILEHAIGEGYPTPGNKIDQCEHGKFGWEDCIACYDTMLFAAAEAIRALKGQSPTNDAPDMVLVPAWLVDFLRGETHWPGHPEVSFGDSHPDERGKFFWRKHLAAAPVDEGGGGAA